MGVMELLKFFFLQETNDSCHVEAYHALSRILEVPCLLFL